MTEDQYAKYAQNQATAEYQAQNRLAARVTIGQSCSVSAAAENQIKLCELEEIICRISQMTGAISAVGSQLNDHADKVFGPPPPTDGVGNGGPLRSGLIGELHEALDRLEDAHRYVSEQARRNCQLA